ATSPTPLEKSTTADTIENPSCTCHAQDMAPLSYHLHGTAERPVLVLLHAYPLDSRMWDGVISHLHAEDPDLPILTVDAPGFGDSPEGPAVSDQVDGDEEPSLDTLDRKSTRLNSSH